MELSILVVSYNTREMTLECLRSVFAETSEVEFEVLVVDNASSDGSAEAIAAEFPDVSLDAVEDNLGFAGGNNRAAEHARGELLLLLNPDTLVLDDAIDRLVAFARENPEHGIWGGKTLNADRSLNPMNCWGRPTLWSTLCKAVGLTAAFPRSRIWNREGIGYWCSDAVYSVDIVSGCFFLIRRELWEELGGFDPAFFMYAEEADLCLRAHALGARPTITTAATIVHYGGASEHKRADKVVRLYLARALLMDRHWSPLAARLGRAMLWLSAGVRSAAFGLAARIRSGRYEGPKETWAEVWRRRSEWLRADAPRGRPLANS